jgi:hypothetical protein
MLQTLPWIIALIAVAVLAPTVVWLALRPRKPAKARPLPTEWALSARPVFSSDERRVYRQLREALPHHIVLSKLPLVRFCQPNDPQQVRYWFDMLGAIHVTFAVCSANGRVLAAIDLSSEREAQTRSMQIKQAVLGACRVRYLRCPIDHLPSIPELQLLVPQSAAASRGPQPASASQAASQPRDVQVSAVTSRRRERTALWQDSGFFHDSFFSPDSRADQSNSEFGTFGGVTARTSAASGSTAEAATAAKDGAPARVPSQVRH